MKTKRAIVVGAGIGGPILGLWLRRLGWAVAMLESRSHIEPDEGAFLGLAPNGLLALDQLGLGKAALEIGYACNAFTFLNPAGTCIGTIDRNRDREMFGWPLTMVRRGELHALLASTATDAGVELRLDAKVVGIRDDSRSPVEVAIEDGTTLSGDVLFGCDGIQSTVRHLSMPTAPEPQPSGLLDFGGFSTVAIPFPPGVNVMVFGRRAFFGAFATTDGETWWFHNGPIGNALDGHRVRLLALHEDDPPWVRDLIEGTDAILGPWPLQQLPSLPRWHHGRVCLLGDAAHAMSPSAGQGASMAVEDAVALARSLRACEDPMAAFEQYEHARRDRVESIARAARRNDGGKKGTGPVAAFIRDRMMRLLMPHAAAQQTRMYAHQERF